MVVYCLLFVFISKNISFVFMFSSLITLIFYCVTCSGLKVGNNHVKHSKRSGFGGQFMSYNLSESPRSRRPSVSDLARKLVASINILTSSKPKKKNRYLTVIDLRIKRHPKHLVYVYEEGATRKTREINCIDFEKNPGRKNSHRGKANFEKLTKKDRKERRDIVFDPSDMQERPEKSMLESLSSFLRKTSFKLTKNKKYRVNTS